MPDGAPQEPSGWRAMRMPEPVEAETWKPARAAVKMARPTALRRTFWGSLRRAWEREGRRVPGETGLWPSPAAPSSAFC